MRAGIPTHEKTFLYLLNMEVKCKYPPQKVLQLSTQDEEEDEEYDSGVYFTALAPPPANSLATLEKNNWGEGNAGEIRR